MTEGSRGNAAVARGGGRHPGRVELERGLTEDIHSGRLSPGARLPPERVIAERYAVSRPIVREVLRTLSERGLVEILPARGTFVRAPSTLDGAGRVDAQYRRSPPTSRELTEARLMLEEQAAALAAERVTGPELDAMQRCLEALDAAGDIIERSLLDLTFHTLIVRASRNSVIETMAATIAGLSFELMLRSSADADVVVESAPWHHHILAALRAGDPAAAAAAVHAHLSVASRLYGPDFDASLEGIARRELRRLVGPHVSLDALLDQVAMTIDELGRP